jgi:tRNA modification GTPase
MDLSAVEGLADLIDAETEAQRRQALRQLEGTLGHLVESIRIGLIDASALIEAELDFADERDVPDAAAHRARPLLATARAEIDLALAGAVRGERLRDGYTVVIAGPPNAGKSTLLNALARRDVALVSPLPGTTRDAIEVRCDLDGLPVTFVDTAGLRDSIEPIEQAGMARARVHMGSADLVLWLEPDVVGGDHSFAAPGPDERRTLRVLTKVDLAGAGASVRDGIVGISALTGFGLDRLVAEVSVRAGEALGQGDAVATRERHRSALAQASLALARADDALGAGHDELAAEDVRLAMAELGRITGRIDVDDVLNRIFAQFCIGK